MKKLILLLIVGWMSMTASHAQLTAGFYGGNQTINPGGSATIEFRFNGEGPVDFSYFDGMYYHHEYGIANSPCYFTVSPSFTTTYELCVVKNRFGNGIILDDHRFVTVTVNTGGTPEHVQMTFSPPSVCKNADPVNLESCVLANVSGQMWFEGAGVVNNVFYPHLAGAGSHLLEAFLLYNGQTYSAHRNISVYEVPQVSLWIPEEVSEISSPFVLSGGRPSGGYYRGDGVVNGNTFDPAVAGVGWHTIYYIYTTQYGCQEVAENKIYVRLSGVGVEENDEESDFAIYPNPTSGILNLSKPCTVEVFSAVGFVKKIDAMVESVDISELPCGVFSLRLFDGENVFVQKVVKQ